MQWGRRRWRWCSLLAVWSALFSLVCASGVTAFASLARLSLTLRRSHIFPLLLSVVPLAALRTPPEPRYYNPVFACAL